MIRGSYFLRSRSARENAGRHGKGLSRVRSRRSRSHPSLPQRDKIILGFGRGDCLQNFSRRLIECSDSRTHGAIRVTDRLAERAGVAVRVNIESEDVSAQSAAHNHRACARSRIRGRECSLGRGRRRVEQVEQAEETNESGYPDFHPPIEAASDFPVEQATVTKPLRGWRAAAIA